MKKQVFLGQVREILTVIGGLGFAGFDGWQGVVSGGVAIACIGWSIFNHEGNESILTCVRKILSLLPGMLMEFGLLDFDKASSLTAGVAPLISMAWSFIVNRK